MKNKSINRTHRLCTGVLGLVGLGAASLATTGCGVATTDLVKPITVTGSALKGGVMGGQQPVSGSTIQLYAAGTNGYGGSSYSLLTTPVTSDANGSFNITGDYTCPSSSSLVYIVATGGNAGSGSNGALAMMAALGACGNLTATTFITINEVTTVASVYALAPFMSGYASVSSSTGNAQGLTNAFATVNKLASIASGSANYGTLPAGATGPVAAVNTVANILAACVNTTGASSTQCTSLFSNAVSSTGTLPTDTIGAALNIARLPGKNVSSLLALNSAVAPFQPSLSSATDFTLSIKYKPTVSTPSAAAVAANGDLWVTNAGNSTISVLAASTGAATIYTGGGLSGPSGIAFDASGNAWVPEKTASTLSVFTSAGVGKQTTATGLNSPSAVAIDAIGHIWVTNSGNNSVELITASGTDVASSHQIIAGGINTPVAMAINPQ